MSTDRTLPGILAAALAAVALGSCGLPGSGTVRTVDDEDVPYQLLERAAPSSPTGTDGSEAAGAPVVFWTNGPRLSPEVSGDACADDPEDLVQRLLDALAAGPSEDARAAGRSSAVPADFGLTLVSLDGTTAEVAIEPEAPLSAEQLPVAVGQVVLTVTSAPTVDSVVLVNDGEPVQVPLPEGALTDEPVTALDYADLVPVRFLTADGVGCPGR